MNWKWLKFIPWVDPRAKFIMTIPHKGHLLDLGCWDGSTLKHFLELRPDLKIYAVDIQKHPNLTQFQYTFHQADLETDILPWPDNSMDAITCMHLIEHLKNPSNLLAEVARLLKPGACAYFEMPRPKTLTLDSIPGNNVGTFTMNFFDDPTHVNFVSTGRLANWLTQRGLKIIDSGISRNILIALAYPITIFLGKNRHRFTAKAHWHGWSAYLIAKKAT